jgi:hypothetical protein
VADDPHRLAEARSLAAHRLIAERLAGEPELLERARARVEGWLTEGSRPYAAAWRELLAADAVAVAQAITEDSERGRALRQCTPFAGALEPRERWRLWAAVREEFERS